MKMKSNIVKKLIYGTLCAATVINLAHALEYEITTYPGAEATQAFGANNKGEVAAGWFNPDGSGAFIYNSKNGGVTDIDVPAGLLSISIFAISESGDQFGSGIEESSGNEVGVVIDKKGNVTTFEHPDATGLTQVRGGSDNRVLVGFYRNDNETILGEPVFAGFTYDLKSGEFSSLVPSIFTIAQGINSQGDTAGSAVFAPGDNPCDATSVSFDRLAFVRDAKGETKYFQIDGNPTSARGITSDGTLIGFYTDITLFESRGFILPVPDETCSSVAVAQTEPVSFPDAVSTFPQYISNSGNTIVGQAVDTNGSFQGFIATRK